MSTHYLLCGDQYGRFNYGYDGATLTILTNTSASVWRLIYFGIENANTDPGWVPHVVLEYEEATWQVECASRSRTALADAVETILGETPFTIVRLGQLISISGDTIVSVGCHEDEPAFELVTPTHLVTCNTPVAGEALQITRGATTWQFSISLNAPSLTIEITGGVVNNYQAMIAVSTLTPEDLTAALTTTPLVDPPSIYDTGPAILDLINEAVGYTVCGNTITLFGADAVQSTGGSFTVAPYPAAATATYRRLSELSSLPFRNIPGVSVHIR